MELTAAGHATADRAVEDLVFEENEIFSELSVDERRRLDQILDKLIDRLDQTPTARELL